MAACVIINYDDWPYLDDDDDVMMMFEDDDDCGEE